MKVIEGNLTMLGHSKSVANGHWLIFSVIEIGDITLQNIHVPTALSNFLSRAINQTGKSQLFIRGNQMIGAQLPGGKFYAARDNLMVALAYIVVGIPLSMVIFGLIPLFVGAGKLMRIMAANKLVKLGAVPIDF